MLLFLGEVGCVARARVIVVSLKQTRGGGGRRATYQCSKTTMSAVATCVAVRKRTGKVRALKNHMLNLPNQGTDFEERPHSRTTLRNPPHSRTNIQNPPRSRNYFSKSSPIRDSFRHPPRLRIPPSPFGYYISKTSPFEEKTCARRNHVTSIDVAKSNNV